MLVIVFTRIQLMMVPTHPLLLQLAMVFALPRAASTGRSQCGGDVSRYIARHLDISYEILANYDDDGEDVSSTAGLRGTFNVTNTGTTAVQRDEHWQIYMSSFRRLRFTDNGSVLGNSGLKARIRSE